MRLSLVFFICSVMSVFWGGLMLPSALIDYFSDSKQNGEVFLLCSLGIAFIGTFICALSYRTWTQKPSLKEMFITTSSVWITLGFLGALPLYFSGFGLSWTDAIFESVSGITTTGATILSHIDSLPKGFLLWRAMMQWIGGIGIVILAITLLPILRIGGMQLFSTENSDSSDKDAPSVVFKLKRFIWAYLFVSCLCALAFLGAGMDAFDAIAHMMTCISTGGFSTHDASMGYFNPSIQWIAIFFMIVGGIPLAIIVHFLEGHWKKIKQDTQTKTYLLTLFLLILPLSVLMWTLIPRFNNFGTTLRTTAFHIVSIITTTGYSTENYTLWGPFFIVFFFILTAVGACTGSTSGAIKIFRFSILAKAVKKHLTLMVSPHAVIIPRYNNKLVTEDVMMGVLSFMTIFCLVTVLCALGLAATGLDFTTSISGALSAVSNVGPGISNLIGPDKTFILLSPCAKWLLIIAMLLGRLEFMTVLVLFLPKLWAKK